MNQLTPIELVEFIYKTQNQQFKYSWYFYYKMLCENMNTLSPIGKAIKLMITIEIAYKTLKILTERRKK